MTGATAALSRALCVAARELACDELARPRCGARVRGRRAAALSARPRRSGGSPRFLNPSLDHLHDPMRLADMASPSIASWPRDRAQGADRDPRRLRRRRHHVDGDPAPRARTARRRRRSTSSPSGCKDGYGLQPAAIERLHADGVALVVSVDCGIRGAEAARRARELGVDLIITDHHEPDTELPPAFAVINPKRHDCTYPDKYLAGVGVALKLVQALCRRAGRDELAARRSSRSPPSARSPTSCRSSARTASSPSSASTCCRAARTKSACARCSTSRGLTGKTDRQLSHRASCWRRGSTPPAA